MGKMFGFLKKNKKNGKDNINIENHDENKDIDLLDSDIPPMEDMAGEIAKMKRCSFTIGVQKYEVVDSSDDLYVWGKIKGNVEVNTISAICSFGEDNKKVDYTTISEIYIDDQSVDSAEDCYVKVRIERGTSLDVKTGTVIYSRDMDEDPIHDAYVTAIGDYYVVERKFELSDDEIEALSVTDSAEIWRLYNWARAKKIGDAAKDEYEVAKSKVDKLAASICNKLLMAEEIYVVFSKRTGEPHMFSRTVNRGDGTYMCTPPNIMVITKAYANHYSKFYNNDRFELKEIKNTEDGKGIYNVFGGIFYLNGAMGAAINTDQVSIAAGMLVEKPDYSNMDPSSIPVTNPDLVRWLLLIGQLEMNQKADDEKKGDIELIYKLYYRFLGIEMTKARFIIPVKVEGNAPTPDANGDVVLHRNNNFKLAVMQGKEERPAVVMYTDWKNLRGHYNEEWNGLIQPMSEMIKTFDGAINPTSFPAAGCYVNTEMYENMCMIAERDSKK